MRRGGVHEMKDHVVGFDRRRERGLIGEVALVPVDASKRLGKLATPPERAHVSARRREPPAQVHAEEAAAAEHDRGGSARGHGKLRAAQRAGPLALRVSLILAGITISTVRGGNLRSAKPSSDLSSCRERAYDPA
jgi:hypothetical protein